MHKTNNLGPVQVDAAQVLKNQFLEYAKDTIVKISQCQKIPPRDTHKNRKPLFPQLETKTNFLKIILSNVFVGKKSHSAQKGALSSQNAFFRAENIFGTLTNRIFFEKKSYSGEKYCRSFPQFLRKLSEVRKYLTFSFRFFKSSESRMDGPQKNERSPLYLKTLCSC